MKMPCDTPENKAGEEEIPRLNRLYSVISLVNQIVIRSANPSQLLDDICLTLVQKGEFKLAWVGELEPVSQRVTPVASYGPGDYVDEIVVYTDGRPEGREPAGASIRQNKPIVQNDFINEPEHLRWHERAARYGFRSSAAFPLSRSGKLWGTLAVCSDQVGYFGEREIALLEETAGDISFALNNLDRDLERCLTEEALRQSEENLRLMFDSTIDGIVVADLHGVTQKANNAAAIMFGFSSNEEMIGLHAMGLIADKDRAMVGHGMEKAVHGGSFLSDNFTFVKKDGTEFPVEISASTLTDANGQAIGNMAIIKDISKRKASEEALKASESKFRSLFTNMAEGFALHEIILDQSGKPIDYRFLEVNAAFENLTGLVREQLIGITVRQAVPGIEQFWIETYGRVVLTGESVRFDSFAAPLGKWFECYAYPAGQNLFAVMFTDISERKTALEILGRYELIANDSRDIILFLNVIDGKILEANIAAVNAYGYTREELLSKTIFDLRTPETRGRVAQQIIKADTEGILIETLHLRKNGSVFPVEVSARGADIEGHRTLVSIIRDISDRQQAEIENQELRSKAEMSSRLAAVGEMAAGIAHEINNPLTGVIGFSELLLERQDLPDDIREDIKIIHDGSQRVKDIVRRMLTFARQTKPQKNRADITELLDNTLELRSYVLKTSNIDVVKDYDPDLPWATVDAGQLQQVFLNLIVNAEYAMKRAHGKGRLTVKTEALDNNIRISISDDGPGMADEIKAKLFQPFFTTKAPGEGTGLGLSLSHGIIHQHGGDIRAESVAGQGTTFIIELPITPVEIQLQSEKAEVETDTFLKHARILVVDDEITVRSFVKTIMTRDGYAVEECVDSERALHVLAEATFDILLVDLRMPGMGGMELYAEVSTRWPRLSHRIIFITGDTSDLNTREYLAAHQIPYITKPFDRKTLEDKIISVLQNTLHFELL